jgi:hypothetical protein
MSIHPDSVLPPCPPHTEGAYIKEEHEHRAIELPTIIILHSLLDRIQDTYTTYIMSVNIETVATPHKEVRAPAEPADDSAVYLGTKNRLPEFALTDKVVCVSGAARGLGLTQVEALLEAGAVVYALDRLPEPVRLDPHPHPPQKSRKKNGPNHST